MGSHWPMLQPMQHLSIFSYRSLGYVMEKAGLRVIAARPAFKTITIGYLVDQLRTLTPSLHSGLKLILRAVPNSVVDRQRRINIGELLMIAQRP